MEKGILKRAAAAVLALLIAAGSLYFQPLAELMGRRAWAVSAEEQIYDDPETTYHDNTGTLVLAGEVRPGELRAKTLGAEEGSVNVVVSTCGATLYPSDAGQGLFSGLSCLKTVDLEGAALARDVYSMENMFSGCPCLETVDMGTTLDSAGVLYSEGMFRDCGALHGVKLPKGLVSLGMGCFEGCYGLDELVMPDSVRSIGPEAFWGCSSLKSFAISKYVNIISKDAFRGCIGMEDVYCYADPEELIWEDCPDSFKGDGTTEIHVYSDKLYKYTDSFPGGINAVFTGDLELYLTYSDTITIYHPETHTLVLAGDVTRRDITDIESLMAAEPGSVYVKVSGQGARLCGTTEERGGIFFGLSCLKDVRLEGAVLSEDAIDLSLMFSCCENLSYIDMGTTIDAAKVRKSDGMFGMCPALEQVVLPRGLSVLGESCFSFCDSLKTLTIPQEVNRIGRGAFLSCNALRDIYCYADPTVLHWDTSGDDGALLAAGITEFHVPQGQEEAFYYLLAGKYHIKIVGEPVGEAPGEPGSDGELVVSDGSGEAVRWDEDTATLYLEGEVSPGDVSPYKNITRHIAAEKGSVMPSDCSDLFRMFGLLEDIDLSRADLSMVTDMSGMLGGCVSLERVEFGERRDTSSVTDLSELFDGCIAITKIDMSSFDTSGVTDMRGVFSDCHALERVGFGEGLDTSEVTDMSYMFNGCTHLKALDLSGWDARNVERMQFMFCECKSLETLDLNGFVTRDVENMEDMFYRCGALTTVDMSSFNTPVLKKMALMFYMEAFDDARLTTVIFGEGFTTTAVSDMASMFRNCKNLTTIDLSGFDTSNVQYFGSIFNGCTSLTNVITSQGWSTAAATDTTRMFGGCDFLEDSREEPADPEEEPFVSTEMGDALPGYFWGDVVAETRFCPDTGTLFLGEEIDEDIVRSYRRSAIHILALEGCVMPESCHRLFYDFGQVKDIDLTCADFSRVRDMSEMFAKCPGLVTLTFGDNVNGENLSDMSGMFAGCRSLKELELGGFSAGEITDMSYMFSGCGALRRLVLGEGLYTAGVSSFQGMFEGCEALGSLELGGVDTSGARDLSFMFKDCSSLERLDLSGFDTSQAEDMGFMFLRARSLKAIIVSDKWVSAGRLTGMFDGCLSLRGGRGTGFDFFRINGEYARIDRGEEAPGYFSEPETDN